MKLEKLNLNIIDNVIKIENIFKSFPYSDLNQPASNAVIPVYDRETDTFNESKNLFRLCRCISS